MTSASENGAISAPDTHMGTDKPVVGSVGLLVEDCEMPDIDWEAYDDPIEPGNNSHPSSEKPSSQPVVNERSDQVTPDPHPGTEAAPSAANGLNRDNDMDISRSMAFLDDIEPDQRQKQVEKPPKSPSHPNESTARKDVNPASIANGKLHNPVQPPLDDENGKTGRYFQATSWRDQKKNRRKRQPGAVPRLYCDLCAIYCTGQKAMDAHLKGKNHRRKIAQKKLEPINKKLDKVYEDIDTQNRVEAQQRMEEKRRFDAASGAAPSTPEPQNTDAPNASHPTSQIPPLEPEDIFGSDDMDIDTPAALQTPDVPQRSSLEENRPNRAAIQSSVAPRDNGQRTFDTNQRKLDKELPASNTAAQNAPQPNNHPEPRKSTLEPEKRASESIVPSTKKSSANREPSSQHAQEPERSELPRPAKRVLMAGDNPKEAAQTIAPPLLRVDAPPANRLRSEPISPRLRSEPISPRLRSEPAPPGVRSETPRSPSLRSEPTPATNLRSEPVAPTNLRSEPLSPTNLRSQPANGVAPGGARVSQRVAGAAGAASAACASNSVKPVAWDPYVNMFNPALVGKEGKRIPDKFLDTVPSMSEWREMRHCVFEKGDDVDKLAFKLLQEILLSPTLGIQANALEHLDRAIKKNGAAQFYGKATGAYSHRKDVPDKLWKRERRFIEGDEQWMKEQSDEDKAMHLFCENVHYAFVQGEDCEDVPQTTGNYSTLSTLPYRGGVTGFRFGVSKGMERDGGRQTRYEDSVELDSLFQAIHQDRVHRKSFELRQAYEMRQGRGRNNTNGSGQQQ